MSTSGEFTAYEPEDGNGFYGLDIVPEDRAAALEDLAKRLQLVRDAERQAREDIVRNPHVYGRAIIHQTLSGLGDN